MCACAAAVDCMTLEVFSKLSEHERNQIMRDSQRAAYV
jgi:hypothetical protein